MKHEIKNKLILGILLIVVGAMLYYYWGREFFITITTIILAYLTVSFLWQILYCRGKFIDNDKIEYNLSKTGETLMIFYFVGVSSVSIFGLIQTMPIWHAWLIPVLIAIFCFLRAYEVYANSNDKLIIADNTITWYNNDEKKSCSMKSFKFKIQKTDCVSMNMYSRNTGWHLELTDTADTIHSLDLKNMNLNGHKKSIEKHLNRLSPNT